MLYVMSDIHGHLQRFESIMDQIKLGKGDHLFVLGDVIDIHPDGIQILQKLLRMHLPRTRKQLWMYSWTTSITPTPVSPGTA